jgi:deazaflavin-dependent oxidoreductase (nitroreductase family)
MNQSAIAAGEPPLSRLDRLKLSIHRALDKRLGPLGVWLMRRSRGGVTKAWNVNAFVLTTRGRRSGRERTVVLQYFPDGGAMVVVAANDGGASHPGWYFNLVTSPDAVVEVDGRRIEVTASELGSEEATRWWQRILEAAPAYEQYRRATARPFPILRLVPTHAAEPDDEEADRRSPAPARERHQQVHRTPPTQRGEVGTAPPAQSGQ